MNTRDVVALQQSPERFSVALYAVRAADDEDGVVHDLKGSLGLGGEVDVTRCVKQRYLALRQRKPRLF